MRRNITISQLGTMPAVADACAHAVAGSQRENSRINAVETFAYLPNTLSWHKPSQAVIT